MYKPRIQIKYTKKTLKNSLSFFRSFKTCHTHIPEYIHGKRVGPQKASSSHQENFARDLLFANQSLLYKMSISPRKCENLRHLHKDVSINPSKVGYLDCLNAPATEMSTIYHMMDRALRIKSQLNLQSIVCVYNQAIYAKAYQIKCKEPMKFNHVFLMMGTFNIILTFLVVIAARFKDAGLRDVVIRSMLVAEGSVDTMFTGTRAYTRAVRSCTRHSHESFSGRESLTRPNRGNAKPFGNF